MSATLDSLDFLSPEEKKEREVFIQKLEKILDKKLPLLIDKMEPHERMDIQLADYRSKIQLMNDEIATLMHQASEKIDDYPYSLLVNNESGGKGDGAVQEKRLYFWKNKTDFEMMHFHKSKITDHKGNFITKEGTKVDDVKMYEMIENHRKILEENKARR